MVLPMPDSPQITKTDDDVTEAHADDDGDEDATAAILSVLLTKPGGKEAQR